MFIEELVEVAIGLVFVWLMLSLAVMQVQEWLAGWLALRADALEDAIWGMLADPKPNLNPIKRYVEQFKKLVNKLFGKNFFQLPEAPPLVRQLYEHPLIKGLAPGGDKPSYISSNQFALALFDIAMTAGMDDSFVKEKLGELTKCLENNQVKLPAEEIARAKGALESLSEMTGIALKDGLDEFRRDYPKLGSALDAWLQARPFAEDEEMLERITNGVITLALSNPGLAQALNSLVAGVKAQATQAEKMIALARTNVETWFNDTMARLTGRYKRNRQLGAFLIALIFAVALNIDSADIATQLWRQPTLRQAVAAQAEKYKLPSEKATDDSESLGPQSVEELKETFDDLQSSLTVLDIPIGWKFIPVEPNPGKEHCRLLPRKGPDFKDVPGIWANGECLNWQPPSGLGSILHKVIGVLISAGAGMKGAPCWFDVLRKLINVRSAGINPDETGDKEQKKPS